MNIDVINEQLDLLENTKMDIKQVLINKGQDVDDNTPFSDYAEEIDNLTDTSDANATVSDILKDKIAYVNGNKLTGSIRSYTSSSEAYNVPCNINQSSSQEQILCNNNLDENCSSIVLTDGSIIDLSDLPIDIHNKNIIIWHIISKSSASNVKFEHLYLLGIAPSLTDNFILDSVNFDLYCRKEDKSSMVQAQYYRIIKEDIGSNYIPLDDTFTVSGPNAGYNYAGRNSVGMQGYYSTNVLYSGIRPLSDDYILFRGVSEYYKYYQIVTNTAYNTIAIVRGANLVTLLNDTNIANAINLNPDIIKLGETVLGVIGTYNGEGIKEYIDVASMNSDITNIDEGEVVKVLNNNDITFYIKDTTMKKLVKEEDTLSPAEYQQSETLVADILS